MVRVLVAPGGVDAVTGFGAKLHDAAGGLVVQDSCKVFEGKVSITLIVFRPEVP